MDAHRYSFRRGLSLVEVVVLLVVAGVLFMVFLATTPPLRVSSGKAAAQNNASQIVKTYIAYSNIGVISQRITTRMQQPKGARDNGTATSIEDVAYILSKYTQLNDASLWFNKRDDNLIGKSIPRLVIAGDLNIATNCADDFLKCAPKSWAFATGVSTTASPTTTPLLWTYGLHHDGTWDKNSPWKGQGGHIAYLDGHVEWADQLTKDPAGISFIVFPTNPKPGSVTLDYSQALNADAMVVNAMGR